MLPRAFIPAVLALVLAAAVSLTCGEPAGPDPNAVASVVITPDSGIIDTGDSLHLTAVARNSAGTDLSGKTITWSALDATLITVSGTGVVRGIWPGQARVVATSEEHADTARVRVKAKIDSIVLTPRLDTLRSFFEQRTLTVTPYIGAQAYDGGEYTWQRSDTTFLSLLTGAPTSRTAQATARLANGTTIVRVRELRGATDSARIVVRQRVANIFVDLGVVHLYRGCSLLTHATAVDARGFSVAGAVVQWSSTDTTLAVIDSTGLITARGAGLDTIVAQAQDVTKRVPFQIDAPPAMALRVLSAGVPGLPAATVGRSQYVTAQGILSGSLTTAIGQFRVAISDTSILVSSPPETNVYQNAGSSEPLLLIGRQQGQVTLTPYLCDAAGVPQTFTVTRPQLAFFGTLPATARTDDAAGSLVFTMQDSTGTIQYPAETVAVRLTATDTTVLRLDSTYRHVPTGAIGRAIGFSFIDSGTARIVVSDSAGLYRPDTSTAVQVVYPPVLFVGVPDTLHLGMRQRAWPAWDPRYVGVDRSPAAPLDVALSTSDSTVARIAPESVTLLGVNNGDTIDMTSGDVRGIATLTAQAYRHTDARVVVVVGRPAIKVMGPGGIFYPGDLASVTVLPADSTTGAERLPTETVTFSLTSSDTTVITLDSSTVTIPAGAYPAATTGVHIKGPGTAIILATDPRAVPYSYAPGTSGPVTVDAPNLSADSVVSLGVEQGWGFGIVINGPLPQGQVVHVTHRNPGIASLADTIAPLFVPGYAVVGVTGIAAGVDTVIASTPGFLPDTGVIVVGTGSVDVVIWPPSDLTVGQTWPVSFRIVGPDGALRSAAVTKQFTLTANANIECLKDGLPITAVTIDAGQILSPDFVVRGKAAGTGTVTISTPNYAPVTKSVTVAP